MAKSISPGTLLISDGATMPPSVILSREPCVSGWSSVTSSTSAELGRQIETAGWTFFYMAGEIHATGFGADDQARVDRTLRRLIEAVKQQRCNCLEITEVRRRSLLGLPYVTVVAHARHIQTSRSFHDESTLPPAVRTRAREWFYDDAVPPLFSGEAVHAWENEGGSRCALADRALSKPSLTVNAS